MKKKWFNHNSIEIIYMYFFYYEFKSWKQSFYTKQENNLYIKTFFQTMLIMKTLCIGYDFIIFISLLFILFCSIIFIFGIICNGEKEFSIFKTSLFRNLSLHVCHTCINHIYTWKVKLFFFKVINVVLSIITVYKTCSKLSIWRWHQEALILMWSNQSKIDQFL